MNYLISFCEKVLFILVILLFAFIPLYPKFPLVNVAGTFIAIRLEDLLIAFILGLWVIFMIFSGQLKDFLKDRLNQSLILFFTIGLLSIFSANFLTQTVTPHLSFLHWARRVEFMMLLPIVAATVKNKKQLIITLLCLSIVVLLVNIYALGQQYLGWKVISTTNSEFSKGLIITLTPGARVNSTFAGHYDLAVFLAMVLVILSAVFFALKNVILKGWVMILSVLSGWVLIMTAARLSFVAAACGILTTLILLGKRKFLLLFFVMLTLILIYPSQLRDRLISTVTVNILNLGQRYQGQTEDQRIRQKINIPTVAIKTSSESAQTATFATLSGQPTDIAPGEPVDTTQLGVYRSFEIRLNIEWPRAINAFLKNPFLGTGYSSIDIATDNDILRSLGEVGGLGTMAFVLVLLEAGKRIYSLFKESEKFIRIFSGGILAMIFAFIINGLFIDVFEASKVASLFWMMLGLNLAALKFKKL